jgi:hypothetical protein
VHHQAPAFEEMLVDDGVLLVKLWFSVSQAEQRTRFLIRQICSGSRNLGTARSHLRRCGRQRRRVRLATGKAASGSVV